MDEDTIMFSIQIAALVDSVSYSTRVRSRRQYFGATYAEARDPRPFHVVIGEREGQVHYCSEEEIHGKAKEAA